MPEQMFNFGGGNNGGGDGGFNFLDFGIPPKVQQTNAFLTTQSNSTPDPSGYGGSLSAKKLSQPFARSANDQYFAGSPLDPAFTNEFSGWLRGNIGKGAEPYPGDVNASPNAVYRDLMYSFHDPHGAMAQMMASGMPIDQTPAWQAMNKSMQRNIEEKAALLKEQYAVGGNLVGSPFARGMADFFAQTSADQNAMLLQATVQAQEAAKQRQLFATEMAQKYGTDIQNMSQEDATRLYQEWIRTRPEYSPLLNAMYGYATTFPPYMEKQDSGGGLSSLLTAGLNLVGGPALGAIGTAIGSKVAKKIGG